VNDTIIRATGLLFAIGALAVGLHAAHAAQAGPLLGSLFLAIIAIELIGGPYTKEDK
jgi:lysozyme family protein